MSLKNAAKIKKILREEGFSELAANAALARMRQESTLNPKALRKNDAGLGKHSRGIFQWNQERLANLEAFARKRGTSRDDLETQVRYFAAEAKGKIGGEGKYGQRLLNAKTPEEAAKAAISLARPRHWTEKNPEKGHGFDNTLNWTKNWAAKQITESTQFAGETGGSRIKGMKSNARLHEEGEQIAFDALPQGVSQLNALSEFVETDESLPGSNIVAPVIDNSPGAIAGQIFAGLGAAMSGGAGAGGQRSKADSSPRFRKEFIQPTQSSPSVFSIFNAIKGMT